MRQPSVLQVLQPRDGGVAEHVVELSARLVRRGWAVSAAIGSDSLVEDRLRAARVAVHTLDIRRDPRPGDAAAIVALRRLDRTLRPDIVHAHSSKAGVLVRAGLAGRRRLLYTPHCPAFVTGLDVKRRVVSHVLEQALVARTGVLLAVCEWERERLVEGLRGARGRTAVVHNGVGPAPAAAPDPRLVGFARGRPLAGMVAVLRRQKDPLALVRAAARLDPVTGCVAIVGEGELAGPVAAEIERLRVGDRVALLPYEGSSAAPLAALDLFVLPSTWEAFPLAPLEAMRVGLPVLATHVGGVGEAVVDGVTGRLVVPGDVAALAHALRQLLADPAQRAELGRAGRRAVAERFEIEPMVDRIEALYRRQARF